MACGGLGIKGEIGMKVYVEEALTIGTLLALIFAFVLYPELTAKFLYMFLH